MRIVDIAAVAGVSPSTVSRVINGKEKISPKTVELVHNAIRTLGYSPLLADERRLLSQQPLTFLHKAVAVLTFGEFSPLDPLCSSTHLKNLSEALASEGLSMLYHHFTDPDQAICPWMNFVCGAIVLRGKPTDSVAEWLRERPYVTVDCSSFEDGDHLLSGHNHVGRLAGRYLVNHGACRFAALNVLPESPELSSQVEGFRMFTQENSISNYDELRWDGKTPDDSPKNMMDAVDKRMPPLICQLTQWDDPKIGVFVPNDWMMAVAYRHIRKQTGHIPDRFVFISSGNDPAALCGLFPRPATIDIGLEAIARNAINLLLMRIHSKTHRLPVQIAIQPRLVSGDLDIQ